MHSMRAIFQLLSVLSILVFLLTIHLDFQNQEELVEDVKPKTSQVEIPTTIP